MDALHIVDNLPDAVVWADMNGEMLYGNAAAETLLGYPKGALQGRRIEEIMPERYRAAHREGMRRLRATRVPVLVGRVVAVEALRADGVEVPIELSLSLPFGMDSQYVLALLRDMRERVPLDADLERVRDVVGAREYARLTVARESNLDREVLEPVRVNAVTRLRVLAEIGELLARPLSLDEVLRSTARLCCEAVGEWAVIYRMPSGRELPDGEDSGGRSRGHPLRVVAAAHVDPARAADIDRLATLPGATRAVGQGPGVARVVVTGEPALFPDISDELLDVLSGSEARRDVMKRLGFVSGAAVPIRSPAGVLGAIAVGSGASVPRLNDDDVAFLQQIADRVGAALGRELLVERLARQEARLEQILDQLPEGVIVWEGDGSTIVNRAAHELAERGDEWPTPGAWPFLGVLGDDHGQAVERSHLPLPRAMAGQALREEHTIRAPDGSLRCVLVNAGPIVNDGRPVAAVAVFQDITAQKRARDSATFLAEASKLLSSSLDYEATLRAVARIAVPELADWCSVDMFTEDGSVDSIAVAHTDPAKIELAREMRRKYPPDLEGRRGMGHVWRTGESDVAKDISDDLLRLAARDEEHFRLLKEVGMRSVVIAPLKAHGHILGAITFVAAESGRRLDDGDVQLIEEVASRAGLAVENARLYRDVQAAVRLREDFLSVASHELKTPLTALTLQVSAFLAAARAGRELSVSSQKLERIDAQIGRLTTLVDQLLDVSRLAEGRMRLDVERCDLVAIVRECAAREAQAARAGARIDVVAPPSLPGLWDPSRLDQVVTNLLSNAVKFGAGKPVEVRLREQGGSVLLSVRDHGVGIPVADQTRIFDRFERAVSARNFGGIGLGLWIVRQLVEAHGGRVSVESVPNDGATFTVELPREVG